ncbi:CRISPR-associated protein Cas5 [Romboutsia sedimentorum]|uniref:CRISPR-associated protein Cas5 n=1 Tax=Romboutsia sedimentorum TaxID=1368474 RepID=UPI0024DEA150|nr:CRISPR-associated protein Cas5 [Romboutsia sedimentorum]MDK2584592.1 CRISPR-associated protein Cas5 [Romboutsia sedimentorum]
MRLNRIIIKGGMGHFKVPMSGKIQQTYTIPPISTVVGILKNIYGDDIKNFALGYFIKHKGKHRDLMTIYKEFNIAEKSHTDKDRFMTDTCIVEYLRDVELVIYTNINKDIQLNDVLVLGKTNCLATIMDIQEIELEEIEGYGYNQYTHKDIGEGQIRRINTITLYNENTDMYDIKSGIVRENIEFKFNKNYDRDYEQNIFLWNWDKGVIQEWN